MRRRRRRDVRSTFPTRQKPDDGPERSRPRWLEIVGVAAGVVGAVAAVIAVVPYVTGHEAPAPPTDAAALSLAEVVVHNGPAAYTSGDDAASLAGGRQTLASSPAIDLTVINRGTRLALVTGVRIEILDSAELPVCFSQGGGPVPVSAHYTILLPAHPPSSQKVVRRALHQQIPANDVDRFIFRFGSRDVDQDEDQLFALRVRLTVSGGTSIDAGRFVLALPGSFVASAEEFPIVDLTSPSERAAWLALEPTWCYRRNLESAARVLAAPGRRSQQMAALGPVTALPAWLRDRTATPARKAAAELLSHAETADGALLAVYAAGKTGDSAFVQQTRTAAARRLIDLAKGALDTGWVAGAVDDAQASLQLRESSEARAVLAQARARKSP